MTAPTLTIMVPTFNRADCLRRLLEALCVETGGLQGRVRILISDNASTDDTSEVIRDMTSKLPGLTAWCNEENVGPDENFCRCIEADAADYFWLFGDDDLPRAGLVAFVLHLLDRQAPDLVYLESTWRVSVTDNDPDNPLPAETETLTLSRRAFARRVHVWTTFMSGTIVRRATYVAAAGAGRLREYAQTNLVQLGWVLGTLEKATKIVCVPVPCIIATAGNTGSYRALHVFGVNFPNIVDASLGAESPLARIMVRRCAYMFLPGLAWSMRQGVAGRFERESPAATLDARRIGLGAYWLVRAIAQAPMGAAQSALFVARLGAGLLRRYDRLLDRLDAGLVWKL